MHARFLSLIAGAAFLLMPVYADAQDVRPGQAYRGLFGPNTVTAGEALSLNGTIGAGWDSNLFLLHREEGLFTAQPNTPHSTGSYGLFSGGIAYSRNGDKLQFNASESSAARRYPDYPLVASHGAAAKISWTPSKRISFNSSHEFLYQPWQTLASFPSLFGIPLRFDQPLAPNQAYASVEGVSRSYYTTSGFTSQLTRQTSLTGGYSYQLSAYDNSAAFVGPFQWDVFAVGKGRLTNQSGLLRFNHGVTRNLGWHAGYGYTEVRYSGDIRGYRGQILDAGVDYMRALSITRRTSLSFSTGAVAVEEANQTHYRKYDVTGQATLAREIGRTWSASASYMRNVEYFETIRVPYFYDGVILQFGGLLSRRAGFHSSAGATYGDLGINKDRDGRTRFDSEYANAGIVFGLSRNLAINTDYVFYMYSLNRVGLFLPGSTGRVHRHDVMVYLSAWVPVFERGRKTNAPR